MLEYLNLRRVESVEAASISGLRGLSYLDKTLAGAPGLVEDRDQVRLTGWTDRVYRGPAPPVTVRGVAGGSVEISSTNLGDVVVWNPWREKVCRGIDSLRDSLEGKRRVE